MFQGIPATCCAILFDVFPQVSTMLSGMPATRFRKMNVMSLWDTHNKVPGWLKRESHTRFRVLIVFLEVMGASSKYQEEKGQGLLL